MSAHILLSCGEASGDLYAGALTRELRALDPGTTVAGLGGPEFRAAGGELIEDYRGLAVTGFTETLTRLPRTLGALARLVGSARAVRPDVLVAIDFPDFNLVLARRIKALGVPVVYYISPQIWAWRSGRLRTIQRLADLVLVIFPFEEPLYRNGGVPVEFVGHPLVDLASTGPPPAGFLAGHGLRPDAPTVTLLPGSRPNEVQRILPDLLAACERVRRQVPAVQVLVARAPNLEDGLFVDHRLIGGGPAAPPALHGAYGGSWKARAAQEPQRTGLASGGAIPRLQAVVVTGATDAALAAADVVVTASGTATVQTALHDKPMVIVYRLSPLSYQLVRRLVRLEWVGMVNLIAGAQIVPELIQGALTPDAVAREATAFLTDPDRRADARAGLARVRERLGPPGASRRSAEAILRVARRQARSGASAAAPLFARP